MTFTDTFVATMAGALAGAIIGAVAAWLFALDLRRRDRADVARDQAAAMRSEWAALAARFRSHLDAIRAMPVRASRVRFVRRWQIRHVRRTRKDLTHRLILAAGVARGKDSIFITALGRAAHAHLIPGPVRTAALAEAADSLYELATCEDRAIDPIRARSINRLSEALGTVRPSA